MTTAAAKAAAVAIKIFFFIIAPIFGTEFQWPFYQAKDAPDSEARHRWPVMRDHPHNPPEGESGVEGLDG